MSRENAYQSKHLTRKSNYSSQAILQRRSIRKAAEGEHETVNIPKSDCKFRFYNFSQTPIDQGISPDRKELTNHQNNQFFQTSQSLHQGDSFQVVQKMDKREEDDDEKEEENDLVEDGWYNLCCYAPDTAKSVDKEVFAQYVQETNKTIRGHASQMRKKTKESGKTKANAKPNRQTIDDIAAFNEWNQRRKESQKRTKKGRKGRNKDEDSDEF